MNAPAPLPPKDDLDTQMLKVARNIAMDIYPLDQILEMHEVSASEFYTWDKHPRFLSYLRSEREAWGSATNTSERTKLKAATVMEQFMLQAHTELHDRKVALNHRVELGKLLSKIAGMGEPKVLAGNGEGGFRLQINIGATSVSIAPQSVQKVINHDTYERGDTNIEAIEAIDDDGNNLLEHTYTLDQ